MLNPIALESEPLVKLNNAKPRIIAILQPIKRYLYEPIYFPTRIFSFLINLS